MTSKEAYEYLKQHDDLLTTAAAKAKVVQVKDLPERVDQLQGTIKQLEREKQALEDKFASQQAGTSLRMFKKSTGRR